MRRIELLAPGGSRESVIAAVQSGADAIYLGGTKFSARAYASNFDEEDMVWVVEYAHKYDVKIYVTINTLLKDEELRDALDYVLKLYELGVDALIVQDLGLVSLLRTYFPYFELHGSTQMTVHNGEGALFIEGLGIQRVVLSRELSLEEIKYISKDLGVETEVFVHGALCICYSGACLMSSLIGGRSGNRGRCAQPCRLPYRLIDTNSSEEKKGYLLSPKDLSTLDLIERLKDTGTSSLKIEGRMKRPEYVAGVVSTYKEALSKGDNLISSTHIQGEKKLMQLFNREGFTTAHLLKKNNQEMMAYSFPRNSGVELGRVNHDKEVELLEQISVGDGVRIGDEGFVVTKILYRGSEVASAAPPQRVKLIPSKYKAYDVLYKTSDEKLLTELRESYRDAYGRKEKIKTTVTFSKDNAFKLTAAIGDELLEIYGEDVQKPLKSPLSKERIVEALSKSGETPFMLYPIEFELYDEGFMPISAINSARRNLVEAIEKTVQNKYKKSEAAAWRGELEGVKYEAAHKLPNLLVTVIRDESLQAAIEAGVEHIAVDYYKSSCNISMEDIMERRLYLKLPHIIRGEFESICMDIEKVLPYIRGLVTSNLGILRRFKGRIQIIGDYKLNIFNSFSMKVLEPYIAGSTVSVELNKNELKALNKGLKERLQYLIYGRAELMVSEYCVIGSAYKESCSKGTGVCKRGNYVLEDRKGENFPVITDRFCRSYVLNSAPINLLSNLKELEDIGYNNFRMDFTTESKDEVLKIINAFLKGEWPYDFTGYTRGHFKRGVE